MMKEKPLLSILADGEWHSGEDLAQALGVSRTAVWKQLNRLMEQGVGVERLRGKGYRLTDRIDLLDAERIVTQLPDRHRQALHLDVFDTIDSTNAYLMQGADLPGKSVRACLADRQEQGRGRRGRPWSSPPGENVYLSMALRLQGGFAALEGLSLVVGVAVARALESLGLERAALKWPNDVLVDNRKLAGILIELQGELEGAAGVIIGIGINTHMSDREQTIDQPWISLDGAAPDVEWHRNDVVAAVIRETLDVLDSFESSGFAAWRDQWQSRDAFFGQRLRTEPDGDEGLGAGIDASGAYLLDIDGRHKPLRAGELSLRRRV
ncbi:bifunctional biotin--[acetyl-CoA-carboxylase] ligase/biotin operon repressor BirA [Marinobacter sp. JSM 1782161]|uniref:bifunctional biotin--[acetyl-CoA-carboxylase] ligase/biotin operon repressor BirA n=1 Tax=Marinobacter sp. JSM 1782161 TaxID=2685906 RepID=UPI001A9E1D28|nr:bifunctional biotin--[acetyl-CoA-carboxylase] ligase/biotin operon repressor BirA [Marinobacter sp. JSM 1782161]